MINKDDFVKLMIDFEKQYRQTERWLDKVYEIFGGVDVLYENTYYNIALKTIRVAVNDCRGSNYGLIDWWINENDWGRNGEIIKVDGKEVILKSLSDLYDFIIEENKSNE